MKTKLNTYACYVIVAAPIRIDARCSLWRCCYGPLELLLINLACKIIFPLVKSIIRLVRVDAEKVLLFKYPVYIQIAHLFEEGPYVLHVVLGTGSLRLRFGAITFLRVAFFLCAIV